ncbi:BREX system ATP-binding domain-containing protein, partial [Psychrobacter sp. S1-30-MNA-CIBAN-0213]
LSTRNKPDGNGLASVVERFITEARKQADSSGEAISDVIQQNLAELTELVGGYDFAKVIEAYWQGHEEGNDELKVNAIRWLRAEYSTKTDAKRDLG